MSTYRLLWLTGDTAQDAGCEQLPPPGFETTKVQDVAEALAAVRSRSTDCVLVSGRQQEYERGAILEALLASDARIPVIFWDRELSAREAVGLVREGACNCHSGCDGWDHVWESIDQACRERSRRKKDTRSGENGEPWRRNLVGNSPAMEDVANTIRLVGPFKCTVLITGETGTGKEVAARALHAASPRANLPMVAVNCSAMPESLLEAELFGHVKGAFTGAANHRVGRFEQAHKSTIFLDEISEMPMELQAKLLRVLQEREFQRLGSSETIKVDVRVIAASNTNLPELVRQGKFREDLFYRLNVVPLVMPPLRKRTEDIPLLVEHFLAKICGNEDIPQKEVTPRTFERLAHLPWPGNVRQLENAVEKAIALSGYRDTLHSGDFGVGESLRLVPAEHPIAFSTHAEQMDFATAVSQFERAMLEGALAKTGGNKTAAAEMLGLKRTTLIMKLRGLQGAESPLAVAG
jgi:DNA-binding NtrC family response regulator